LFFQVIQHCLYFFRVKIKGIADRAGRIKQLSKSSEDASYKGAIPFILTERFSDFSLIVSTSDACSVAPAATSSIAFAICPLVSFVSCEMTVS
jgi:hypothetical protein